MYNERQYWEILFNALVNYRYGPDDNFNSMSSWVLNGELAEYIEVRRQEINWWKMVMMYKIWPHAKTFVPEDTLTYLTTFELIYT